MAKPRHGMEGSRIYRTWSSMKTRCLNRRAPNYPHYGGRGIRVCTRWLSFEGFYADMGDAPEGASLDRIDNDGDYEPGNCRWASIADQNRNRSVTVRYAAFGESKTPMQWAHDPRCVVSYDTLKSRVQILGWAVEQSITTPTIPRRLRPLIRRVEPVH